MTTIFLAGGFGKMGQAIQQAVAITDDLAIAGILSAHVAEKTRVPVFTSLAEINVAADVWVDVTNPASAYDNGVYALTHGFDLVMGTSGLDEQQVAALTTLAEQEQRHAIIVPNFALSAVLMMQFAQQAARYFPDAEILEIHHADKLDAPSGTARATAKLIAEARQTVRTPTNDQDAARGDIINDVPVHAMRLPGYVAEEEVIFGAPGEALHIKQSSFSRESFMAGVLLAVRQVHTIDGLVVGLEHILN